MPKEPLNISVLTEDEQRSLISGIEDLAASIYRTDMKLEEKISKYLSIKDKEMLTIFLNTGEFDYSHHKDIPALGVDLKSELEGDQEMVVEKLKKLSIYLNNLPKAVFTLAIEPTEKLVNELKEFLMNGNSDRVVIQIKVEKNIVAGFKLEFAGKYSDYSYESQIDSILSDISIKDESENI